MGFWEYLKRKNSGPLIMAGIFFLLCTVLLWKIGAATIFTGSAKVQTGKKLVIIDAGHGCEDSGKVGVNGALEKDINFAVAGMLAQMLQSQDVYVKLTRKTEEGFYPKTGNNKKLRDMQARVKFMNENAPDLVVSVHQNSFPDPDVWGAQTFYYTGSREGQRLAKLVQSSFAKQNPENHRQAKENDSYYLLKNVNYPVVIAECGFLSNPKEAQLLCDSNYQRKIAWAIHLGIMQYLNGGKVSEVDENQN